MSCLNFFISECKRFEKIAKEHEMSCEQTYVSLYNNVQQKEYGFGGEMLHRGFYCPSVVADIIIGNVKRGIVSKSFGAKMPHYVYGFIDGSLSTIEHIDSYSCTKEYIIRQNDVETGILFSSELGIQSVCECCYQDNKINSYTYCLYDSFNHKIVELTKEIYEYSSDSMTVTVHRFLNTPKRILQQEEYTFSLQNGYLLSYTVKPLNKTFNTAVDFQNFKYKVSIRRKV